MERDLQCAVGIGNNVYRKHKHCRESAKREDEVLLLAEMQTQGGEDENDRVATIRGHTHKKKYIREGEASKRLLDELKAQEDELWFDFEDTSIFCRMSFFSV